MKEEFSNWKDFNNVSVKVKIDKRNYNAIIKTKEDSLSLEINMTNNIEKLKKLNKNYDVLNGNLTYNNEKITFLNCLFLGKSTKESKNIAIFTIFFRIDRILLGDKLSKLSYKKFNKCSIVYNNIDCFTNDALYDLQNFSAKSTNYSIDINGLKVGICFSCNEMYEENAGSIVRKTIVNFISSNKKNINEILEQIYMFRNFLMIILKRNIDVERQYLYIDEDVEIELFDCHDNQKSVINSNIQEQLNDNCLKIENINNISVIYQNFFDNYKKLIPFLELYYNLVKFDNPNLTKFVNSTTMLEYYSNEFDSVNAILITKSKKTKKDNSEYVDMIKSLMININSIYNFTEKEIDTIAENIKNARVYYIHYIDNAKKLTYNEQFWYSYFIQDLVLLNVYKMLQLDINKHMNISFLDFYYDKQNLL